jgi:hypothetical protein
MSQETDKRMWSTTPKRLSEFVGALLRGGIPSTSVRNLQKGFRENRIYPARDFPQFCVSARPDAFFSYHSAQNFVDLQEIVWKAFDFAAQQLMYKRPDLTQSDLEPMISDEVRLWVDFMFIDQSARDLREELDVLPRLLQGASAHFVLGNEPLTRAWCCYEIALFNQRLAEADVPPFPGMQGQRLLSYIAPSRNLYFGWEGTETSEIDDKTFIAERISAAFPGGFDGFNNIMSQANSIAVLPLTEGTLWTTPAADDNLRKAAEAWYTRSFSRSK